LEKEFLQLITQNQGILYKVCSLYATDPDDKEDLFQEIVLQVWKSYPTFRKESKFTTWLYRIALNTAITSLRKQKKWLGKKSISKHELQIPEVLSDKDVLQDQVNLLYKGINELSKVERAVIMLYLEECSYQEIAQIIGITESNVGVRINRIKKKLKNYLSTDYYELR
jgi:RNA polymerase sigma factor (sigma-70 family)